MTIPEILAALAYDTGVFPLEAFEEAIAQRDAIIPELLRILEEDTANLAEIAPNENYMALINAIYLLAQFREPRAYPLLVNFFFADKDLAELATGDIVTDGLDRILASVCQGDTGLIERVIEDETLDEFVRGTALNALVVLVAQGVKSRDEVMAYFKELFRGKLARENSYIWTDLMLQSCELYPDEVMADIEQAYADNLIETMHFGIDDIKRLLANGKEQVLAELKEDPQRRFIEDVIEEIEPRYYCDDMPPLEYEPDLFPPPIWLSPPAPIFTPLPRHATPKVGRNEPCPCGSGKKYKRCCGAQGRIMTSYISLSPRMAIPAAYGYNRLGFHANRAHIG